MKRLRWGHARRLARGRTAFVARLGLVGLAVVSVVAGGGARAQEPAPPGMRVGTAEVPIVGGNAAGARERALDEALRQAVVQALTEQIADAQPRAAAIKALQARARTFVKRYQIVQEGEVGGSYDIRVEAEIDDVVLRRAAERWTAPAAPPAAGAARAPAPAALLVVVSGPSDAGPALIAALSSVGIKAQLGDAALVDPTRALQTATKASLGGVAFLSASVTDEGIVRGPGQAAVSCRLAVKVVSTSAGRPPSDLTAAPRSFAEREPAARADCLARAAATVAARLLPPAAGAPAATGGELRAVVLDADIVEPSVVAALLKTVRGLGSVSAAELRRIVPGRAEIRVRTRLAAPALGAALMRESSATITLANLEIAGDLIRLRARLRPPLPPPTPVTPSPPASTTP